MIAWSRYLKTGEYVRARYRIFHSYGADWEQICSSASSFVTQLGPERLISINTTAHGGSTWLALGGRAAVIVWYWDRGSEVMSETSGQRT